MWGKVKIITEDGVVDFQSKYLDETKDFEVQINDFIKITQSLDYRGKLPRLQQKYFNFKFKLESKKFNPICDKDLKLYKKVLNNT